MFTRNYLQLDRVDPVFESVKSVGNFGCPVVVRLLFFVVPILRFMAVFELLSPISVAHVFSLMNSTGKRFALFPVVFGSYACVGIMFNVISLLDVLMSVADSCTLFNEPYFVVRGVFSIGGNGTRFSSCR